MAVADMPRMPGRFAMKTRRRFGTHDDAAANAHMPMKRYLMDFLGAWLRLLREILGPIALFAGVIIGMSSASPWIYHPVLCVTLLLPACLMARYAITGRSAASGWSARVTNGFGTGFLLLSAVVFLLGYCYAIYTKIQG